MSKLEDSLVDKMLKSDKKLYLCITGGGTGVVTKILENGGASNVFLGANIPYNEDDTRNVIGSIVKCCSERAAFLLSLDGYNKASCNKFKNRECVCVSSTSSLRKNGVERADRIHEAFICVRIYDGLKYNKSVMSYHIVFWEDRTRKQEEELLSKALLAISCSALTLCKWELSSYQPMLKDFGFTDKDKVELTSLSVKEIDFEEEEEIVNG